jgi:hypothetical protein
MKITLFAALAFAIGSSAGQAEELAAAPAAEGARFAAMSLADGMGLRAIVSNVLAPANGTQLAPCQVQVSFIGADGSLIGDATTKQLKPGESTSVAASHPPKLVRAIVNIGAVVDPAKVCALRTSVEIFDIQTGATFVSVPGEPIGSNGECNVSVARTLSAAGENKSGREDPELVATTSSLSGGRVSRRNRRSGLPPKDEVRATLERFVAAQNAHDIKALESLLLKSPNLLWITRGTPVWGSDSALKRFSALDEEGTWRLDAEASNLRITLLGDRVAQLYVPIMFTIEAPGQPAQSTRFLMNQLLVKARDGWKVSSILPIPVPTQ